MLTVIIIWLYAGTLWFIYGVAALRLLQWGGDKNRPAAYPPFAIIALLGLVLLSTLIGYLSLFIKIGLGANIVTIILAGIFFYCFYGDYVDLSHHYLAAISHLNKILAGVMVISVFFILVKSTGPPAVFDSGLYHAQAIRWIEEYPAVPGLGNLHGRLAFNSAWFLPGALFSLTFLTIPPFHALSGLLLLCFIATAFAGAGKLLRQEYTFSNLVKAAVIIPLMFLFQYHLSSPATDLPTALFICVTFIYYLEIIESKNGKEKPSFDTRLAIVVILSAFAVLIKLSALPMLIFVGYIVGSEFINKRLFNVCLLIAAMGLILLPWFLRNIILSGYLVYPFPAIDLFNFDWKIPRQAALMEKAAIENYARNPGLLPGDAVAQGISYWFPAWIRYVTSAYRKKLAMIALPSGIILVSAALDLVKTGSLHLRRDLLWKNLIIYLTALGGCLFWFVNAPDMRLGYGFIIMLSLIIYLPVANLYRARVVKVSLVLLAIFLLYFEGAFLVKDLSTLKDRWLFPAPYPEAPLRLNLVGSKPVYSPMGTEGRCWYAPLPCTPHSVARLEFRGDQLGDGFRSH